MALILSFDAVCAVCVCVMFARVGEQRQGNLEQGVELWVLEVNTISTSKKVQFLGCHWGQGPELSNSRLTPVLK